MRMFEWGQLVSVQRSLCDAAAPFPACLSEATRATVNLAVPEGPDVVYIPKINALDEPRRPPRVGGRLPMHCTALGKAILAHGLPGRLDALVSGGLVGQTSRSVGFTHRPGDRVTISSPHLGTLMNTTAPTEDLPPWEFGLLAMSTYLAGLGPARTFQH
ncbi:IclR family transcriptional regulator C-terminal domain-containing protein [Streptomyces sp. NPDC059455]|uniref:IclR family transcriptional regulator domain-containing protein n=1 Tax=Streptomyces sp. NPDC059455 TaxID=3346837 RepID=UPI0036C986FB